MLQSEEQYICSKRYGLLGIKRSIENKENAVLRYSRQEFNIDSRERKPVVKRPGFIVKPGLEYSDICIIKFHPWMMIRCIHLVLIPGRETIFGVYCSPKRAFRLSAIALYPHSGHVSGSASGTEFSSNTALHFGHCIAR